MSGGRGHVHERSEERWRLRVSLGVTALILLVELAGGWMANSLALLSDAGHVFTDLGALALCYGAFLLSVRPATARKTFGWHRLEILAALLNGALLIALAVWVFVESLLRLNTPSAVHTGPMLIAAVIGLAGNLATLFVLYGGRKNLNIHGALLHVIGDTLSSVGVIAAGGVILVTGWMGADALAGMLIAGVIVVGAVRLLGRSVDVLLEATPTGIDLIQVSDAIAGVEGVEGVHDLHIWSIASDMPALSGHVVVAAGGTTQGVEGRQGDDREEVLNGIKRMLHERFSISHSTLQVESPDYQEFGEIHD